MWAVSPDSLLISLFFIIYTHPLGYLVQSHGHTDHLDAAGFHICISSLRTSPQHADLNVKLPVYISTWMCNRHLILPMLSPNFYLTLSSFSQKTKIRSNFSCTFPLFSSWQLLFLGSCQNSESSSFLFISHLRYGLSANHNTSTCKTYKEGNHISHLHCHYSSRSHYYFSPDLLHQLPEWYSRFYPCSPSDYLSIPIKVILWRHTSDHITPLLKTLQWPSSYPQGFDMIRAPIAFNLIPSHFPICFLHYSHPGFLAVP